MVRYPRSDMADLDALWDTRIDTPAGPRVPLGSLAGIVEDRGPNFIGRENVQRRLVVTCNVAGRDLGSTVADIRERVEAGVALPEGYRVELDGQFDAQATAARALLLLGMAAVVGIFLLLVSALRSPRDAAIVMINLPLALIGGVVGVLIGGGTLSIAAIIGFISLFGIATRNGITGGHPHPPAAGPPGQRRPGRGREGGGRPRRPRPDDRPLDRPRPPAGGPGGGPARQRDPGPPRARHRVRTRLVDGPQHDRGADRLPGRGHRAAVLRGMRDGAVQGT